MTGRKKWREGVGQELARHRWLHVGGFISSCVKWGKYGGDSSKAGGGEDKRLQGWI